MKANPGEHHHRHAVSLDDKRTSPPLEIRIKHFRCNKETMKTVATLALLAGTAAAFAPQQASRASTSLAAFDDALGAQEPLGFWYVEAKF